MAIRERATTSQKTPPNSLSPSDADSTWTAYCAEVASGIVGFIRTMGLPARTASTPTEGFGRLLTRTEVRGALLRDYDLHAKVLDEVERDFRRAIPRGGVDRDQVGGFLNTVTQRRTWKCATRRAKEMLVTLQPLEDADDVLSSIADGDSDPEALFSRREACQLLGEALAQVSPDDQQLIDVKLAGGGYAELAAARGTTVGALKTRAHRVWQDLCCAVRNDGNLPTTESKKRSTKRRKEITH